MNFLEDKGVDIFEQTGPEKNFAVELMRVR
jgi:hypothetical protein